MDLAQRALTLGAAAALAPLPPGVVVALAVRARVRSVAAGESLQLTAEDVALVAGAELEGPPRALGDVIGLVEALAGTPQAQAIAVRAAGDVLVLHRDDVLGVLREHAPAMRAALAMLVAALRGAAA